jgi:hypothetical protein
MIGSDSMNPTDRLTFIRLSQHIAEHARNFEHLCHCNLSDSDLVEQLFKEAKELRFMSVCLYQHVLCEKEEC